MECYESCESFFCKTHTFHYRKAYQRYMDALKALLMAYKSDDGRRNEATVLALENYIHHHEVFISTCNNVEIKRQEGASNSNASELGPFSLTSELNQAHSELIDYSESDAQYGGMGQVAEEQNMISVEEEVEHNTANETVEAAEETMEHNTAEETVEGITVERGPALPDYCPFCDLLYDMYDHCPLCET